ncbi:c-type cytochrome [Sphingobacterium suaedae]|uniref:C-type cytochrome n=1 Tax=Sphingobacterium suaedae TaxID=1686402 RepID=A0ABW5KBR7_9SPHI
MSNTLWSLSIIGILCIIIGYSCQPNVSIETAQYAANGKKLYGIHCQNCHGASGEGLGALYPPLTDTIYLKDNRSILACIVKNGLNAPVVVQGQTFEGTMPGVPQLTPVEIAYILTYVTTRFGNSTETYTQEEVNRALKDCR